MAAISAALRMAGTVGGVAGAGAEVRQVTDVLGKLGQSARSAADPVGVLGQQLNTVLSPLNEFVGSVRSLNSQFVGLFDPAEVKLFDLAVRDLYAVIGEQLAPITREATHYLREAAAVMNGLTPLVRDFIRDGLEAMRPAFESTGELIREMLAVAQPFIQATMDIQVEIWRAAAEAVKLVNDSFRALYQMARELLGLPEFQPRDATGKAASSTSVQSVSSYLTSLQLAALRAGTGEEDVPRKQLKEMVDIKKVLADLPGHVAAAWVEKFNASQLGQFLKRVGEQTQGIRDNLPSGRTLGLMASPGVAGAVVGSEIASDLFGRFDRR